MAEPWFDPVWFGALYGAIGGGVGGTLGGLLGAAAGVCAPRGIGRPWILGGMKLVVAVGFASLAFGLYAWSDGQPWGIWYAPVLTGVILSLVTGCLIPVVRRRYDEAEARRMQAADLRQA
jgi:hypothetical protein